VSALKILEEWVKSYKSESLVAGGEDDGAGGGNESEEEEAKVEGAGGELDGKNVVTQMLNEKQSELCIATLSILNNLDAV
jgi:hypothetical protein